MEKKLTFREQVIAFERGEYDASDVHTQCKAGWYDWFCKDKALPAKTKTLFKKAIQIMNSPRFDADKTYIFFKNNCPCVGPLRDDFRICDIETGNVLYTVTPAEKSIVEYRRGPGRRKAIYETRANVWGKDNDFQSVLFEGTWREVKTFFYQGYVTSSEC